MEHADIAAHHGRRSAASLPVLHRNSSRSFPILENLQERTRAQLVNGQAGGERLFLRDGATGDAAQKEIQQTLPGGRVVEDIAEERGERGFLDEGFEPAGSTR